jgi:hypothetical protein
MLTRSINYIEIDNVADDVGVPQGDDKMLNEAADTKVNDDIPMGN